MKNSKTKLISTYCFLTLMMFFSISCNKTEKKVEKTTSVSNTTTTKVQTPLEKKIASGKKIYKQTCIACHQVNGQGIPGAFPPLAKSDYLNADIQRAINIVHKGKTGEITVNGKKYNTPMTAQAINSKQIANVLTYVYSTWENNKTVVTTNQVEKIINK